MNVAAVIALIALAILVEAVICFVCWWDGFAAGKRIAEMDAVKRAKWERAGD